MAKSQKHSNREAKKPKQIRPPTAPAGEGLLAKASGATPNSGKKRG